MGCLSIAGLPFAGIHLYACMGGEKHFECKVSCQEHDIMTPARSRTQTAQSRYRRANHEGNAPPIVASVGQLDKSRG